jgi:hypothetical protein
MRFWQIHAAQLTISVSMCWLRLSSEAGIICGKSPLAPSPVPAQEPVSEQKNKGSELEARCPLAYNLNQALA